ncbi:hypothetical protein ACHWQZ_G009128 [Mnemiopsis leidyi]
MTRAMDQPSIYMAEYNLLTEKLVGGKEAVDMISEFWEKLAYIEYNYAKSIAQLCNSRHGKLFKMFNDKPSEYFRPLQSLWGAVLEDLLSYSESHLNVAYTLQREVKPALSSFSQDDLTKQIEVAMHGKKVMTGLKEDLSKLEGERKKVYKTMLSQNSEEMKEIKEDVRDSDSKTKQLQKLWIRSKDSHAHAFNVTMPSILEELNNTSVRRVEAVCNSVGHFTSLVSSTGSNFSTTSSTLLAAQTAAQSVRYTMSCSSPEPPGDLKLNMTRSEMIEFCQTPAKKFFNNIQEKVFPTTVGNMFVNPIRDRSNSGEGDHPFKDISQRVADMWSNIRTRTLSGNVSDLRPDDEETVDDALLDPEDVEILDPGTEKGVAALSDHSSILEVSDQLGPEEDSKPVIEGSTVSTQPAVDISPQVQDAAPLLGDTIPRRDETRQETGAVRQEGVEVSQGGLNERDMIISLSADPDTSDDYVVVDE